MEIIVPTFQDVYEDPTRKPALSALPAPQEPSTTELKLFSFLSSLKVLSRWAWGREPSQGLRWGCWLGRGPGAWIPSTNPSRPPDRLNQIETQAEVEACSLSQKLAPSAWPQPTQLWNWNHHLLPHSALERLSRPSRSRCLRGGDRPGRELPSALCPARGPLGITPSPVVSSLPCPLARTAHPPIPTCSCRCTQSTVRRHLPGRRQAPCEVLGQKANKMWVIQWPARPWEGFRGWLGLIGPGDSSLPWWRQHMEKGKGRPAQVQWT